MCVDEADRHNAVLTDDIKLGIVTLRHGPVTRKEKLLEITASLWLLKSTSHVKDGRQMKKVVDFVIIVFTSTKQCIH